MNEKQLNALFGHYLTCCYAYYKMDVSLISDEQFDQMCKVLARNYDKITHRFKLITQPEDFEAGTGYAIRYPEVLERSIRWFVNKKIEVGDVR